MNDRAFSDSVQYAVVKANLEKNDGLIKCEMCGKQLHSISDCHFDHIIPYAKGGKSIKENCQILCINCNQKSLMQRFKGLLTSTVIYIRLTSAEKRIIFPVSVIWLSITAL